MNLEDAILTLLDFWEADEADQQKVLDYVTRLLILIESKIN